MLKIYYNEIKNDETQYSPKPPSLLYSLHFSNSYNATFLIPPSLENLACCSGLYHLEMYRSLFPQQLGKPKR